MCNKFNDVNSFVKSQVLLCRSLSISVYMVIIIVSFGLGMTGWSCVQFLTQHSLLMQQLMQSFALIPSAVANVAFESNFSLLRMAFIFGTLTFAALYLSDNSFQYFGMPVVKLGFASYLTQVRCVRFCSCWRLSIVILLLLSVCCCWGGGRSVKQT